jgi:hypothetical protein
MLGKGMAKEGDKHRRQGRVAASNMNAKAVPLCTQVLGIVSRQRMPISAAGHQSPAGLPHLQVRCTCGRLSALDCLYVDSTPWYVPAQAVMLQKRTCI